MAAKNNRPPKLSLRLIKWLCREELHEELEGNLHEYYHNNHRLAYWYEVLTYLRPSTLKSFTKTQKGAMFIFNPLLSVRNLVKQGSTTLINMSGFTIGLVCVFFLYFYIQSETGADQFHADKDKIYRAIRISGINGTPYNVGVTSGPYAPALQLDFPDAIKEATRALPEEKLVSYGDKKFLEEHALAADANFFSFFSFPLAEGVPDQVLKDPRSVVLSMVLAQKYFGSENPIGKTLVLNNEHSYTVTGIMGEWPSKSHLKFDLVIPIAVYEDKAWFKEWWSNGLFTYVKIETPEIATNVIGQFPKFIDKYFAEDFKQMGARIELTLEPLADVYFNNETRYDPAQHGDLKTIYVLSLVGIGILFIACFNYINLSIAQSFRRAKEVGIRKVLGGNKTRLVLQFIGESTLLILASVGLAVFISMLFIPNLNSMFDLEVVYRWTDPQVFIFLGSLVLSLLVLSSVYPAMLLSSFKPTSVLKGKKMTGGSSLLLRKGLVIAQFSISICMISLTLLVSKQISFMADKELGFNKEAVLLLNNNPELRQHKDAFVELLRSNKSIEAVSYAAGEPGGFHDATMMKIEGSEENHKMRIGIVDDQYLDVFDIRLVAGRNFSRDFKSEEEKGIIINEKALEDLGLTAEEAVGKLVSLPFFTDTKQRIVGIAANYHFTSLKMPMEPLILLNDARNNRIAVRITPTGLREGTDAVIAAYEKLSPSYPIVFNFLDDKLDQQYASEKRQSIVFSSFALVSIFLACLGILGLASYTAQQRQKEFGIRKVLGASCSSILQLISKEFVLLIVIAFAIASPVAWYFIDRWLEGFAYHISLGGNLGLFLASGVATAAIALLTIMLKTYRAAVSNPIESIRYE